MHYSAYSLLGVIWLSLVDTAQEDDNKVLKEGKQKTAEYYIKRLLPQKDLFKTNLFRSAEDLLDIADREFDYV